ncbi:MAG: ABC transporter ATP-binding protein [Selenomonadaceae bacterium]
MHEFLKIFTIFTRRQLLACMGIFVIMVIGAMFESVGIGAILPLISVMGQPDYLSTHARAAVLADYFGISTHSEFVMSLSLCLLAFYIGKNLYMAFQSKVQIYFTVKNQIYFSRQMFALYLTKPYLFHVEHNTGVLLRNVSQCGGIVFSSILLPTFRLLSEVVTAAAIWLMLMLIDPFTALSVAVILLILLFGIIKVFRRTVVRAGEEQNVFAGEMNKAINQGLGAIKETKVMRKEQYFYDAYSNAYSHYGTANRRFSFLDSLPRIIIEAAVVVGLLLLIIVKLLMGNEPMDIVPLLGVLALAAFRLMPSANRIVSISNGIRYQLPFFNTIYDDLLLIRDHTESGTPVILPEAAEKMSFERSIDVRNLSFRYPEGRHDVLDNVSFSVPKGSFAGIVGPSGAGKTTFVDIMLGLLPPTGGSIYVDGIDIEKDIRAWQANLAYVPQDIYLIDATIKENIALGVAKENINEAKIERALKMAELWDFIKTQDNGVDTIVGERGVKLSGGQRQRIGIARALFQEPDVLVLDEATSALDNATEKEITNTILKLKGKITIISIAHRVSTLEECDFKIKFANGKAELIKANA